MDISKLPKLSDTKSQTDNQIEPIPEPDPAVLTPARRSVSYANVDPNYRSAGIGGDIWISLIIGILLCFLGGSFASFCKAKLTHQPFHSGYVWPDDDSKGRGGQEVAYFDLQGFTAWSDMGVFLFGLILLFEAASKTILILHPGKVARAALMLAILLTVLGVMLNIVACVKMFSIGVTPLLSGFAVAFGGWILFDEWATLQRTRPRLNQ